MSFGEHTHEWADTEGRETRAPEAVDYWNASLMKELEAEVDIYVVQQLANQSTSETTCEVPTVPTIDYMSKGFDKPRVVVLVGGDHGDKNCPINTKVHLTSPEERKQKGVLNLNCPMIQFASLRCSKDTYDLLQNTVMPRVAKEIQRMQTSSIVTVFNKDNPVNTHRSYAIPANTCSDSIQFGKMQQSTIMVFRLDDGSMQSVTLADTQSHIPIDKLQAKIVVS